MNWLRLHVSNLCNFKCPNCHVFELGENILPNRVMSQDVFVNSLNVYTRIMKSMQLSKTMVSLYGGETLANKKVIKDAISQIGTKLNDIELVWVINTNGSLLKEEDVIFFKNHNVEIHVSVDGKEEIHNISRPTHKGKGTFHMVMPALELIKSHQAPAQINSYMMPSNYLHLKDIVDIAESFEIKKIYLDQFYNLEMITHKVGMEKYREIYYYGLSKGININGPWGRVLTNVQKNIVKRNRIPKSFCLDVNIDGSCYFPIFSGPSKKMGLHIDHLEDYIKNEGWNKTVEKIYATNDLSCKDCIIKDSCYGGAIEQVHYHIGDSADTKVSCDFFRDWISYLNRPVYFKKIGKMQFLSVLNFEVVSELMENILNEVEKLQVQLWPINEPVLINIVEYFEELVASSRQANLPTWAVATTNSNSLYHKGAKTTPALRHELAHLFLAQVNLKAPPWIIEGICEWVQGTTYSPMNLYKGLVEKNLFKLIQDFGAEVILIEHDVDKPGKNLLYMQSQSFIEFMVESIGEENFKDALKNAQHSDFFQCLEIYTKKPLSQLIVEFQACKVEGLRQKLAI
jgi:sulfatase maturation enzyme AslB (radical SAM superfamily)